MKNICVTRCSGYYKVKTVDIENPIFPIEIKEKLINLNYTKNLKHCYYCDSVWTEDDKYTNGYKIIGTKNLSSGKMIWNI